MVTMMKYEIVNERDARDGRRDEKGRLHGFIREIRAIRGCLPESDQGFHGVHGFPAAWARLIWVKPVALSQTKSIRSNHQPQIADPSARLGGLLGKGRTSLCKSLISMIVSDSSAPLREDTLQVIGFNPPYGETVAANQ